MDHERTHKTSEPQMGFKPTIVHVLDALTSELLRTRWGARVIFVGRTCEPHYQSHSTSQLTH